jgi:hypothetical protein
MYVGLLVGLSMCAILKWRRGARCDGFGSESLAIAERLAHSDPGNAGWQRDLSLSSVTLLKRLDTLQSANLAEDWDGAWHMDQK